MQPGLDVSNREAEDFRNLLRLVTLDMVKYEHSPKLRRQRRNRTFKLNPVDGIAGRSGEQFEFARDRGTFLLSFIERMN